MKCKPNTHPLCRRAAADGAVLLKNEGGLLPLAAGTRVALFGRIQTDYYKSGTGSGGLVNVEHVPSVLEALRAEPLLAVDEELAGVYEAWVAEHPFDNGHGWGTEPWSQEEMPLEPAVVAAAAKRNEVAVVILGRTAGEDRDNSLTEGSYLLSKGEAAMLEAVTGAFDRVAVLLNVGNMIDVSFADRVNAVMYLWQGGANGAPAAADLLCGRAAPAGRLPDTQLLTMEGHPADADFGDPKQVLYTDDIYVGYRYFETFAPERVQYPFGFGLSYTAFAVAYAAERTDDTVTVTATVTNTGARDGREVVQVYYAAPCGKLGNPARQLAGFAKTGVLKPGESEMLTVTVPLVSLAAYDDAGVTGYRSCYVREAGVHAVYAGTDVREAREVLRWTQDTTEVVRRLREALAPVTPFDRLCAEPDGDGVRAVYRPTPLRTVNTAERIAAELPKTWDYTGDRGIRLRDVAEGRHTVEELVAQMSDTDLCAMVCGEGMNSPKVTPGTGGVFGGTTAALRGLGIPPVCVTDGPSGLRLDDGSQATAFPNGTLLAATWDEALVQELYAIAGDEMRHYRVDMLLGPGMNLHRHPLCGRNFEYFSEDPVLTGKIGAAITRGIAESGVGSTIKHFCANNQETHRYDVDAVISERALREVYLRGFEIAVHEGGTLGIMTTYNAVNGRWNASQYDLTTTILRGEWGYTGFVMTDWWAKSNEEGGEASQYHLKDMVRAGNDVYMVCPDALSQPHDLMQGLDEGKLTRGELQRCAANLVRYALGTPAFERSLHDGMPVFAEAAPPATVAAVWDAPAAGEELTGTFGGEQECEAELVYTCNALPLAQVKVTLTVDGEAPMVLSVCGTEGQTATVRRRFKAAAGEHRVVCEHGANVTVQAITVRE